MRFDLSWKSKGDLFECNEWNPAWYARPEEEFEREGTPLLFWTNFSKFRKILENFGKNMYVHFDFCQIAWYPLIMFQKKNPL